MAATVLTIGPTGPNMPDVSDRRTQIVDAASRLITQRGFAATSVDDVVARVKKEITSWEDRTGKTT